MAPVPEPALQTLTHLLQSGENRRLPDDSNKLVQIRHGTHCDISREPFRLYLLLRLRECREKILESCLRPLRRRLRILELHLVEEMGQVKHGLKPAPLHSDTFFVGELVGYRRTQSWVGEEIGALRVSEPKSYELAAEGQ